MGPKGGIVANPGQQRKVQANIAIPTFVTALARVVLYKAILAQIENGGTIYYTDTDSIITDKPLPEDMISNELGDFKLERVAQEGVFVNLKNYAMKISDSEYHIVSPDYELNKTYTLKEQEEIYNMLKEQAISPKDRIYKKRMPILDKKGEKVIDTYAPTMKELQKLTKLIPDKLTRQERLNVVRIAGTDADEEAESYYEDT